MAGKRGNGEGSIFKRKDGSWCGMVTISRDPTTGKPKRVTKYGKTRQEVAEKIAKIQSELLYGTYIEPTKITVLQWLETWLKDYKKSNLRPTTYTNYEYLIRIHIGPSIGGILLKDLRSETLQRLYNEKYNQGNIKHHTKLSYSSVRLIHVVIHQALQQAVNNNLILRNVSESTSLPKRTKKEMRVLTLEEQKKLISHLGDDTFSMAFLTDLATGMRLGELLGLQWKDIDLKEGVIRVSRSLSRVKSFDENNKGKTDILIQEPKTKSGKRSIPIPESVISILKLYKTRQKKERLQMGALYENNDFVFSNEYGKNIDPRYFTKRFSKLIKECGLEHTNFHALRHTFATRLLETNEHPKVVQELLGHASITMTLDTYSHVMPELKKAAAAKLNNLFIDRKNPSTREG